MELYLTKIKRKLGTETPNLLPPLPLFGSLSSFCQIVGGTAESCFVKQDPRTQLTFEYLLRDLLENPRVKNLEPIFKNRFKSEPDLPGVLGILGEFTAAVATLRHPRVQQVEFVKEGKQKDVDFLSYFQDGSLVFNEVKCLQDNFGWQKSIDRITKKPHTSLVRPISSDSKVFKAIEFEHQQRDQNALRSGREVSEIGVKPSAAFRHWRQLERDAMGKFHPGNSNLLWVDNDSSTLPHWVGSELGSFLDGLPESETAVLSGVVTFNKYEPSQIIHFWENQSAKAVLPILLSKTLRSEAQSYIKDAEEKRKRDVQKVVDERNAWRRQRFM